MISAIDSPDPTDDHVERGDEGDKFKLEELTAADVMLLGGKTYEGFRGRLAVDDR